MGLSCSICESNSRSKSNKMRENEDKRKINKKLQRILEMEKSKTNINEKEIFKISEKNFIMKDLEIHDENNIKKKKEISDKIDNNSVVTKNTVEINANYMFKFDDTVEKFDINIIYNINGILKLLCLKYISTITKPEKLIKIKNKNVLYIFQNLNKDLELINKNGIISNEEYLSNDIQVILKEKEGSNIIEYAKYINSMVKPNELEEIINMNELEEKKEIYKFLNNIIKYDKYNAFFEEEFSKAQLESIFDYSIINLVLLDNKNFLKYKAAKDKCPNCTTRVLFHGTQIEPASKIISTEFKFTRKAFYGMGIYFTDKLDYVTFYSGGNGLKNRRQNFNKIFPPNSTYSFIAAEIYYNKNLFKHVRDNSYYVEELKHSTILLNSFL